MQYHVTGNQLGQQVSYVIDVAAENDVYVDAQARQVEVTSVVPYGDALHPQPATTGGGIAGFSLQRVILVLISALGILASVGLPWATAKGLVTVYGTAGDGWITLFLYIIALVAAACAGNRLGAMSLGWSFAVSIPSALAALIGIVDCWNVNDKVGEIFSIGFGLILVIVCGVANIIIVFTVKK